MEKFLKLLMILLLPIFITTGSADISDSFKTIHDDINSMFIFSGTNSSGLNEISSLSGLNNTNVDATKNHDFEKAITSLNSKITDRLNPSNETISEFSDIYKSAKDVITTLKDEYEKNAEDINNIVTSLHNILSKYL